jgi:hypothetical protein
MDTPKPSRRTLLGTLLLGLFGLPRSNNSTGQPAPISLPVPLASPDPSGYTTTVTYVWGMTSSTDGQPSPTASRLVRTLVPAGSTTSRYYAWGPRPANANG